MREINIKSTEVLLRDYELGQGKIIVTDPYQGSYSHYWGAMGGDLSSFLKRINSDYFADKLCTNTYTFSGKKTARNIRRFIKEEMSYDLPWYSFMEGQKELRKAIKEIEECDNEYHAMSLMENMHNTIFIVDMSYKEEKEFLEIVKNIFNTEPWHFLGQSISDEYKFLKNLHKDIKKKL